MNTQKILKIVVPVLIVVGIAAIWLVKNANTDTTGETAPVGTESSATDEGNDQGDFSLAATEIELETLKVYGLPIIIDFGAGWCAPCREFEPILEAVHAETQGKAIIKYVDVDTYDEIAAKFPVQVIPTQVFIASDGTPYVPREDIDVEFILYEDEETGEHIFTLHQGGLTVDEMRAILIDMGMEQ
ncbi:MAG: thioredoxin family protein [Actinobacteria bacterium]|nr:thioredoxin family protein [Actinomycetota bacterium]